MPTVTPITESFHDGGFIVNNPIGLAAFEQVTLLAGAKFQAGSIVGKITATGKYKEWNPASVDGSQTVAGVVRNFKDATSADKQGTLLARGPVEVNASELVWFTGATGGNITTGLAGLKALNIIPR